MVCSLLLEALAIGAVFLIVKTHPYVPIKKADLLVTPLTAPPTNPAERKPAKVNFPKLPRPPQSLKIQVPLIAKSSEPRAAVSLPALAMPKAPEAPSPPTPPAPRPVVAVVHPAAFSTGSSAKPTVKLPARRVQTGGFGDPKGFSGEAEGGSKGNVARLGSFDLPSGPGHGNGAGGAKGAQGVVASAGFGNGIAVSGSSSAGTVQSSGFGNATAGAKEQKSKAQSDTPDFVPVRIISKPKPVYPPQAKALHLEGDVLLSVNFEASGKVRIIRVVRGLGHGMDESAERAAEAIVFKPAQRDGRAVDMQANVHIIFQLAY